MTLEQIQERRSELRASKAFLEAAIKTYRTRIETLEAAIDRTFDDWDAEFKRLHEPSTIEATPISQS